MSDHITIVGNIAGDPRHTHTPSGIPITTFRVASAPRRFDRTTEKWVDGETSWFSVSAFRALALNAAASLQRGERVIVSGRLRIRNWESGERSGTTAEIDAEAIGHDLLWGTSRFERAGTRHSAPESADPGSNPAAEPGWYPPGSPVESAAGEVTSNVTRDGGGNGTNDGTGNGTGGAPQERQVMDGMLPAPDREHEPVPF